MQCQHSLDTATFLDTLADAWIPWVSAFLLDSSVRKGSLKAYLTARKDIKCEQEV